MMKETAEVIAVKGNYITVRVSRHSACEGCSAMCGLSKNNKYVDIELLNSVQAKIGDKVSVSFDGGSATKISVVVYLIPLVFGILAFVVAYLLTAPEWAQLVSFLGGCVLAFVGVAIYDKKVKIKNPIHIEKLQDEGEKTDE